MQSGGDLARGLGWPDKDITERKITRGGTSLDVARGSIGGQPAALFATVTTRNGYDPLDSAALYAYHAATDWGLLADQRGLTVFNSHWLSDGDWFQLAPIAWDEVDAHADVLRSLSPAGLIDRTIERLASRQRAPSAFLRPVDDELVDRLDTWRDETLRYARNAERVDDLLQTLFAQLFVLRTVEDRGLDPLVPPASDVLRGHDQYDLWAWRNIVDLAREHIGSDLFDEDVIESIPPHVVAGVIRDLYSPRGLPRSDARYDFSWIESDVLGVAYEKYLATVLQPTPVAPQIDLFLRPERGVERISVRKSSGTYFTPKFIRDYLATRCIDDFFHKSANKQPPKVIDFACGSGSFLVAAVDQILKHLKVLTPGRNWARELIAGGYIVGIDIDPKAVTTARLNLWQRLVEEPDALPLPRLSEFIIAADGLRRDSWGPLNKLYQIALGNPPFLATNLVTNRNALEANFETAKGRYDFSYLFIEQALNILESDGHLGMVVPNRIFRNRNGVAVRSLLASRTALMTLVDFGSTRPFEADAYIGCIVAKKRDEAEPPPPRVRVIEVRALDAEFLTALLLQADSFEEEVSSKFLRAYDTRHPQSGTPWLLLSDSEQRARILFEDVSVRLDTIADLPQGIRTGGNDLFIFDLESTGNSGLCKAVNGLGDNAILELDLLCPVVHGSEVQRYQLVQATKRLLYPYRRNQALTESELESRYPNTWAYLIRNRDLLSGRASLKKSGGKFYELVWPRDETWLRSKKLMIRDLAPRTAFALDASGETFLVGGTAVVPQQTELLLPLLAYLNSATIDALIRRSTPQFRGDFQKFEPQHIQAVPVLTRLVEDQNFASKLAELATLVMRYRADGLETRALPQEAEIDKMISRAASERGITLDVS